jgi:hypothetical protein
MGFRFAGVVASFLVLTALAISGQTPVSKQTLPRTPWGDPDLEGRVDQRDPPDGRYPPLTLAAQRRPRVMSLGTYGDGPFDSPLDLTLYDRCVTRGVVASILPVADGNALQIPPDPPIDPLLDGVQRLLADDDGPRGRTPGTRD